MLKLPPMDLFYVVVHLFGVAIGAGGAFVSDALFLRSARDRVLSDDEIKLLNTVGVMVWLGLGLLVLSGIAMFLERPEELLNSVKFIAKMSIVLVIILNGIVFHTYHIPHMKRHVGKHMPKSSTFKKRSRFMLLSGSISVTSWLCAVLLGALPSVPFTLVQTLGLYCGLLIIVGILTQLFRPFILGIRH